MESQQNRHNERATSWLAKRILIFLCFLGIACLVAVPLVLTANLNKGDEGNKTKDPPDPQEPGPPSPSVLRKFKKAAVCTDTSPCSDIGRDILKEGGTAIDATIGSLFCSGIVYSHTMGLGGGFIMTIYKKDEGKAYSLIARDKAPMKATRYMFKEGTYQSIQGGLAVAVPGELIGYWEAWQKFGKLEWKRLIQPSIDLCRKGYKMSKHLWDSIKLRKSILLDPEQRKILVNPKTGEVYPMGTLIRPSKICDTLEVIANEGGYAMHNGSMTEELVKEIQETGGIITVDDFHDYRVEWTDPVSLTLRDGKTVYSSPPPGSGTILLHILGILEGYNLSSKSISDIPSTILTTHRTVEAFKYAFAKRAEMGDPDFINMDEIVANLTSHNYSDKIRNLIKDNETSDDPEHYGARFYTSDTAGTAHVSVVAPNGDAVSVTSTINLYFGAGFTSTSTGILFNSGMDDFSIPGRTNYYRIKPTENNLIEPGKRPLSSASPTIVVDNQGDVRLVVGAAGGSRIISAVSWVIIRNLWLGEDLKKAVDAPRIHHQVFPMTINYEFGVLDQIVQGLKKLGHEMHRNKTAGSIVCAVAKHAGVFYANSDFRRGGDVSGID